MADPGTAKRYEVHSEHRGTSLHALRFTAGATPAVLKDPGGIVSAIAKTATGRTRITFRNSWRMVVPAQPIITNTTDALILTAEVYARAESAATTYLEIVTRDGGLAADMSVTVDLIVLLLNSVNNGD